MLMFNVLLQKKQEITHYLFRSPKKHTI